MQAVKRKVSAVPELEPIPNTKTLLLGKASWNTEDNFMFTVRLRQIALTASALLLGAALSSSAQETRATLNGHVQDSSGAAVPGATVTLHNNGTGADTSVKTGGEGDYTAAFLVPGNYSVRARAQGFKEVVRNNVELHVQDQLTVDLTLSAGETSEVVTVTADAPLLDEGTATRGSLIDNAKVTELPIIARNPINLANLAPGVVFNGNQSFQRPFDNGDVINFSVNGGLRQTNAFLIDGAPDDAYSDTAGDRSHANLNVAFIPSAEVTQEFKVVSNFYDAQYGRTGGGVFNVGTKVGTNNFHGSLYYFFHRYWTDANYISNKFNNLPLYSLDPVTHQFLAAPKLDQFGGEISGPVRIPRLYNGKDHTFFLFGIEQYNEDTPSPSLTGTITAAERNGDFSQAGVNIYDPYTTRLDQNGNCCIRDQFPGNVIPASRLTGAGYLLAQAFPSPTASTNTSASNFNVGANLSRDRYRNWIARIDQNIGQKERLYARYAHARRNQFDQGSTNYPLPLLDAQDPLERINDNAVADSLTQFTSRLSLDIRASYTRYNETVARSRAASVDITKYGFSSNYAAQRFVQLPPKLAFDNVNGVNLPCNNLSCTGIGSRDPRYGISNLIGLQPSVEYLRGRQAFHVGADIRDFDYNAGGASFTLGQGGFMFRANETEQNPTLSPSNGQGSSIASMLLGFPGSGIISYTPNLAWRFRYWAIYLQDDIKVTPRLTINAGLRYDVEGSPHEIQNRQNRGFDFNATSPLASAATGASANCPACASLKGGLLFAGVGSQPQAAFNTQYGHIQPRIGAVYRLTGNTMVRGGYGLFYLPEAAFGVSQGFAQDTQMVNTNATAAGATIVDNYRPRGNTPTAQPLNDPFATGVLQPTGSSLGLGTFQGLGVIFNNPNRSIPYVHQYSFGFEQQLPSSIKIDAEYVGSRTMHVNTNDNQAGGARNIDVLSRSQIASLQQAAVAAGFTQTTGLYAGTANLNSYLAVQFPNPFAGKLPGTNLNGATVSRQQLLLPYPQFTSVSEGQESVGRIWYDSFQLSVEKRYSHGLTILGSYTWSKTLEALAFLNPQDAAPFRNIGAQDRPQRLVVSGVYELPFGRGHRFLGNDSRLAELAIGGWEMNLWEVIQSGTPVGLPSGYVLLGDPRIGVSKSRLTYFNTCTQFANGTVLQPNAGRSAVNQSCSNPIWRQINSTGGELQSIGFQSGYIRNPNSPIGNLSVSKRFKITDTMNAQFRFEAFNFTNTWIPNGPNMSPTSGNFGTTSASSSNLLFPNGQSNLPRIVQMGAKFNF